MSMIGLAMAGSNKPENWEDHWPLPPAGSTETQIYDWRLRNRATDAINGQTDAMKEQVAEVKALQVIQKEIRDLLAANPTTTGYSQESVELIFRSIDAVKGFVQQ